MTTKLPMTLRAWKARRAGGRITAVGIDISTGLEAKITNIDTIEPPCDNSLHEVCATDKDGVKHRLTFP